MAASPPPLPVLQLELSAMCLYDFTAQRQSQSGTLPLA